MRNVKPTFRVRLLSKEASARADASLTRDARGGGAWGPRTRSGSPATPRLLWVGGRGGWLAERGVATSRALVGLSLLQRPAATAERAKPPFASPGRCLPVSGRWTAWPVSLRAVGKTRRLGRDGAERPGEERELAGRRKRRKRHLVLVAGGTRAPGGTGARLLGAGVREDRAHRERGRLPSGTSPPRRSGRLRSGSPGCPPALLSSKVPFLELSLCWL